MSEQNPYERLSVSEDASFEEIQAARDHLVEAAGADDKSRQSIEAAYDAVLMDRLRRRQEGKIRVPEGIRFPEKLAVTPPSTPLPRVSQSPSWLQQLLDTPSPRDILLPAAFFTALGGVSFYWQDTDGLAFLLALG
ncbi:MAG TPA: CPP1-like family protein, partial [Candidatus Caenarcaniphilales bacterium]